MNHRSVRITDAVARAAVAMRAASQALSLLEGTSSEEELCGLLACTLSREADVLEKTVASNLKQ